MIISILCVLNALGNKYVLRTLHILIFFELHLNVAMYTGIEACNHTQLQCHAQGGYSFSQFTVV